MSSTQDHLLDRIKKLPGEIRLLIEKRIELYMIEFGEKFSQGFAKAVAAIVSILVFGVAIIFGLFALAYFIGDLLDSYASGFAVVTALLLVISLVLYLLSPELIEEKVHERIASVFLDDAQSESSSMKTPRNSQTSAIDTSSEKNNIVQQDSLEKNGELADSDLNEESESQSTTHTIKNINLN